MTKASFALAIAVFAPGLFSPDKALAQVTISHLTAYDVDATGTERGSEAWDTLAGIGPGNGFDLFIVEGKSVKGERHQCADA